MAEHPKVEALWQNIGFIQESMATGGLSTIAGHLKELDLITRQNYYDLATYGRGPVDQAAMLMRTVEVRVRDNPDVYFTRFIEALRRSHLGNVADRLVQALPENQRHSTLMNMITSNIPSPSGSTQTTATSHNDFSSFSNQPLSRYLIPPNISPYNPLLPYFLPVQQRVLPPSYPQAYQSSYSYMLQQWNDPTGAHAPSDFPSPPPNPVHLNQQYSVLPSNTNTPILHQNPSLRYEQHPLPPFPGGPPQPQQDHHHHSSNLALHYHQQPFYTNTLPNPSPRCHYPSPLLTDCPPPQRPRLDSPHLTSFTPTSNAVAHYSLGLPTPATTIPSSQLSTTSQRVYYTPSREDTLHLCTSHVPLSQYPTPTCTPSPLSSTSASQVTSYIPSPAIEHSLQQQTSHSPLSPHPTPSYTPSPLSTTAVHSPAPPSPSATTSSAVTGSSSAQVHQNSLSPYLQRYVQHLKNRYISINTPVYDKEQGLLQAKVRSFINIALVHKDSPKYTIDSEKNEMLMDRLHGQVDAIQKKKTKLRMCNVCKSQDGRLARCVLVEGAPGVGKTTFAFELCKRWARGEILQEWPVVVIIKLRDHRIRTAQNMYDLLHHPDHEVRQGVVKELVFQQDGKDMLLILDGYDELTDNQRDFDSVIQCLMSRDFLCQSTLMVTSRPLATRTIHDNFVQCIDQHIEVLGFTEKNIKEYIQSACGDKPRLVEDFKSYLSSHPFSSALMFNPLQCAIVTDLYRSHWESGDKSFAPKTLTDLYTGLVHILLLRYLKHHSVYKGKVLKIKDLSDLPEKVSQQLKEVTELAAEGIENQQYVFDEQEDKVPSESLGLMQAEEEVISGIGTSESFHFLHLTLQEYLAAVNYSQDCSSPEQLSQLLTRDD